MANETQDPFERLKTIVEEESKKMQPDPANNYLEKSEFVKRFGEGPEFIYKPTDIGKKLIESEEG